MPVLELPPPAPVMMHSVAPAEGADGRSLQRAAEEAFAHWLDRADSYFHDEAGDPFGYEITPFVPTHQVPVRFKYVGRGKPLPMNFDDDEGE